jgi:hypothetical protein
MEKTYLIQRTKISNLLNELDKFMTIMTNANSVYGDIYTYGIDIYTENDEVSKGNLYKAEINIIRE